MNHVWAYDFVFDTCADGRTLKCLTVIDEFTRECLAIDVASGIRSGRVIEVLDPGGKRSHGLPGNEARVGRLAHPLGQPLADAERPKLGLDHRAGHEVLRIEGPVIDAGLYAAIGRPPFKSSSRSGKGWPAL